MQKDTEQELQDVIEEVQMTVLPHNEAAIKGVREVEMQNFVNGVGTNTPEGMTKVTHAQAMSRVRLKTAVYKSGGIMTSVLNRLITLMNLDGVCTTQPISINQVNERIMKNPWAKTMLEEEMRMTRGALEEAVYREALGEPGKKPNAKMAADLLRSNKFNVNDEGDNEYGDSLMVSPAQKRFTKMSAKELVAEEVKLRNVAETKSIRGNRKKQEKQFVV